MRGKSVITIHLKCEFRVQTRIQTQVISRCWNSVSPKRIATYLTRAPRGTRHGNNITTWRGEFASTAPQGNLQRGETIRVCDHYAFVCRLTPTSFTTPPFFLVEDNPFGMARPIDDVLYVWDTNPALSDCVLAELHPMTDGYASVELRASYHKLRGFLFKYSGYLMLWRCRRDDMRLSGELQVCAL